MRISLALLASVLAASACGGGNSSSTAGSVTDQPAEPAGADDPTTDDPTDDQDAPESTATEPDPADADATGSDASATDPALVAEQRRDAAAAAAANGVGLVVADTPEATEVLVIADGSVTTLADAADGDRPLLIWFWAPH